jgi:hypothetical protein
MAARGVAVQHLPQAELEGGPGRQHAVAPRGIPRLLAHGHHRIGWELGRPICLQAR